MKAEMTLVLIKPDGVERGLIGRILMRFEDAGLRIAGAKMMQVDADFARKHYTDDLAARRGEAVRNQMVDMLSKGPVMAIVLEGIEAIQVVRKMVGATEPKEALPGTIRGDFAHMSYGWADYKGSGIRNLIHASSSVDDAKSEIGLWFAKNELTEYVTVHDKHIRC